MKDFLEEVKADFKEERIYKLFLKILPIAIGTIVIIALLIALKSWFNTRKKERAQESGDMFYNAIVLSVNNEKARSVVQESLEYLQQNTSSNLVELVKLTIANESLKTQDIGKALSVLSEIANNQGYNKLTQNYAKLLYLTTMLKFPKEREVNKDTIEKFLRAFDNDEEPLFGSGNLIKALFLCDQQNFEAAEAVLKKITSSNNVSFINKNNAQAILANIELNKNK